LWCARRQLEDADEFYFTLSNDDSEMSIEVNLSMHSIQCSYFSENESSWSTNGCFVVNATIARTLCKCDRLAEFGASAVPFVSQMSFQELLVSLCNIIFAVQ
jgi:hypothetical protein